VAASRSGTMAYLAPEILLATGAVSSKARDWWALGIMVRELVTGERPFEEMTAKGIDRALMLRGVDLGAVEDSRLRLLCRGLLIRDPEDRWGAGQVRAWLAGESPEVRDDAASVDDLKPFMFENTPYREKRALARAFVRSWETALRRYFVAMGTETDSSEGWLALRSWLQQFTNPEVDDVESLVELIDERLKPPNIPADLKLLSLVQWLDPQLPPVYRGLALSREHLPAVARAAALGEGSDQSSAARVVQDMFAYDLLPWLGRMHGGQGLADVDREWRALESRYGERLKQVALTLPPAAHTALGEADAGRRKGALLMLALDEQQGGTDLREAVSNRAELLTGPVDWFQRLVDNIEHDPIDAVLALATFPVAVKEAEAEATARRQREEAELRRREQWEAREQGRLAAAPAAATTAYRYLGACIAAIVLIFLVGVNSREAAFNALSALAGIAAGFYIVTTELDFTRMLGADYPAYTVLASAGARIRQVGDRIRNGGWGWALGSLVLVLVALSLIVQYAFLAFAVMAGLHWWWLRQRRKAWQVRHESDRARALESL
jgi:hypothetical protein